MTSHLLLLGAGFSRNWGGWLATEAFEYLLGSPEVVAHPELRRLLWKHQGHGGFEAALAEVQTQFESDPQAAEPSLEALQDAISRMFVDMNKAIIAISDWQFGQRYIKRQIGTFLTRFDAIFTLNQDVLLEHHYAKNVALIGNKRWKSGIQLPGMSWLLPEDPMHQQSWSHSTWRPLPESDFEIASNSQPLYKLHGSSNWISGDRRRLLIMGGEKMREIWKTPILNWYASEFVRWLSQKDAKLMVIGYSFRDEHINAAIVKAIENGLRIFIVAPEGAELGRRLKPNCARGEIMSSTRFEELLKDSIIGASRRSLRDTFGDDDAEYRKVIRFFEF
jgi:hypothetical protein